MVIVPTLTPYSKRCFLGSKIEVCTLARNQVFANRRFLSSRTIIVTSNLVGDIYPMTRLPPRVRRHSLGKTVLSPNFVSIRLGNYNNMRFGSATRTIDIRALRVVRGTGRGSNYAGCLPALVAADSRLVGRNIHIVHRCLTGRPGRTLNLRLRNP